MGVSEAEMNGCIFDVHYLDLPPNPSPNVAPNTQGVILNKLNHPVVNSNTVAPSKFPQNNAQPIDKKPIESYQKTSNPFLKNRLLPHLGQNQNRKLLPFRRKNQRQNLQHLLLNPTQRLPLQNLLLKVQPKERIDETVAVFVVLDSCAMCESETQACGWYRSGSNVLRVSLSVPTAFRGRRF